MQVPYFLIIFPLFSLEWFEIVIAFDQYNKQRLDLFSFGIYHTKACWEYDIEIVVISYELNNPVKSNLRKLK